MAKSETGSRNDSSFFSEVLRRRVPQLLGIYLGISWGTIQFVDWLVREFSLSPDLTKMTFFGLISLVPAVLVLAYGHGAPGRDGWRQLDTIAVPMNLAMTLGLLIFLFHGRDLGATTRSVTVVDEDGQSIERTVAKQGFRQRVALFTFAHIVAEGSEAIDDDETWLPIGVPLLLQYSLNQNPFVVSRVPLGTVRRAGFEAGDAPVSLLRKAARQSDCGFFLKGTIEHLGDDQWRVKAAVHSTDTGRIVEQRELDGDGLLPLVDELGSWVQKAVGVPSNFDRGSEMPIAEHLSGSVPAVRQFLLSSASFHPDGDLAEREQLLLEAVGIDESFAIAQLELANLRVEGGQFGAAKEAIDAALRHDYRLLERDKMAAKGLRYFLDGKPERRIALYEMWTELYPEDPIPRGYLAASYLQSGKLREAQDSYEAIFVTDPEASWTLIQSAALSRALGEPDVAIATYQQYASLHPERSWVQSVIGNIHRDQGDFDKARAVFEKTALLHVDQVAPPLGLAKLAMAVADLELAEQYLGEAQGIARTQRQKTTIAEFRISLSRLQGKMWEVTEQLEALAKLGENGALGQSSLDTAMVFKILVAEDFVLADRTADLRSSLVMLDEQFEPPLDRLVDWGYMVLALLEGDTKGAQEKLVVVRSLIEEFGIHQPLPTLRWMEGRIQLARGEPAVAVETFNDALSMLDESQQDDLDHRLEMQVSLGRAQRLNGDSAGARETALEVLRLFPAHPPAHVEMARLSLQDGHPEEARQHLQKALEVWAQADPSFTPAVEARALLASL